MKSQIKNDILTVFVEDRIDSYTVTGVEKELFSLIETHAPAKSSSTVPTSNTSPRQG